MYNYKIILEYDGTNYNGLQIQNNDLNAKTIEGEVLKALQKVCESHSFEYSFCGRTDAGVHAKGQVMNVKTTRTFVDSSKFALGLNYNLRNENICALSSTLVPNDFNARFSCVQRSYRYIVLNRSCKSPLLKNKAWLVPYNLDFEKLNIGMKLFLGTHDFSLFRNLGCTAKTPIKTIDKFTYSRYNDEIWFEISAQSFMYKMVRNIVGSLIDVARGYVTLNQLENMIQNTGIKETQTANACGLYFLKADFL